jgi:cupin fold WbuC family metalloprotein
VAAEVQLLTRELIAGVRAKAEASPRLRMNHNFHSGPRDNPHRFLNVLMRGTYVRPHRHIEPPKPESWVLLEGTAQFYTFDDAGAVTGAWRLSAGGNEFGIDMPAGTWHTLAAVSECVVIYEVKPGPWEPATDKDFAVWAPLEGTPEAPEYLSRLLALTL